ncbi:transmembrane emp24 domain-containing protein 1a [Gouania willdenowi]|uniref:Transmembrane emp24 domain-containing protein 1-like n=1 Tax=Gouania willdenowi TaxID=441366 RepID=A0A8C5F007_GOUWI|nr:transmembrane emp24 domain-containing protein 1-like [Gouania willdenowi]
MLCHQGTMTSPTARLCLSACLTLTGLTVASGLNQGTELTFLIPATCTECFYQTVATNDSMEVEYQVIAGSGLDIGFALISPSGIRLVSDFRQSDGVHIVDGTEDGDYGLCFDNSFSKRSEKLVFLGVMINPQSSTAQEWPDVTITETMVEYKLEEFRMTMDQVHVHLERSRQLQASLRAFEARDRHLLEDNLWRVSFWSSLNMFVMLLVAATQVYTLRRLFDSNKLVRT